MRKLVSVSEVQPFDLYDITVENDHCFELSNGVIAHNSMFPKAIMSGGTGPMYAADTVIIFGKSQEKDGGELAGWTFTMNIEKSRRVKEKSKFPFTVMYEGGIQKWSGMLDIAMELGFVKKPSNGWYSRVDPDTGEIEDKKFREKDTHTNEFWGELMKNETFCEAITKRYMVGSSSLLTDEDIDQQLAEIDD